MTLSRYELKCDAVLFDLDGVLVDSTDCVIRQWKNWADHHGLDLDRIMQVSHGVRTIETIQLVAPHLDAPKEAEQFMAREVIDTAGVVATDGAGRILAALQEDARAIVTSGSLELAKVRLMKAELPVPRILVTADDVKRGKPDPEAYRIAAERLGTAVHKCIVLEDAPAGVEAGKKAGMRVIGIASTHSREELLGKGADIVIDQLANLEIQERASGSGLLIQLKD